MEKCLKERQKYKLFIFVVVYKNEDEVYDYACCINRQTVSSYINLVIVVNELHSISYENFKSKFDLLDLHIDFFCPCENLGYLNGTFYGFNEIKQYLEIPKWSVISNTDIVIEDEKFFECFLSNDYSDDIWCIGPSVYSAQKKSYDNPHYVDRIELSKINRLIWIHRVPFLAYLYHRFAIIKGMFFRKEKQDSMYVYSCHGCFFLLRDKLIKLISGNRYEPFLYSEESYIAEKVLFFGKKCYYDSNIEIIHKDSSVTSLIGIKKKSKYISNSLKYIKNNFYVDNK